MDFTVEVDMDLDNHINKCRCCFKDLHKNDSSARIVDENIQTQFLQLTQITLITSSQLSSLVCQLCFKKLQNYTNFRSDLIEKQSKLYEFINQKIENPPIIKTELDDEDFHDQIYIDFPLVELKSDEAGSCENVEENNTRTNPEGTTNINFCSICMIKTSSIRRHVNKFHLDEKNFFCDFCDYSSYFKVDLTHHMKTHQLKKTYYKEQVEWFCESCGLKFSKRFHLNAHVKAKHTEKVRNHICRICGKGFYSTENLKKHVDSHNQKQMPCEHCGKLFSCLNNLRTHLYYHSEPKFICDVEGCGKKFFMKKRLRSHTKAHNNQKDHVCNFCEKSYFSQNDLNRHIASIHQKLRFFCAEPNCQGSFSRREYYKKHATLHHQNLAPEEFEILLQKIRDAVPTQNQRIK